MDQFDDASKRPESLNEAYKKMASEHTKHVLHEAGDDRETLPVMDAIRRAEIEKENSKEGTFKRSTETLDRAVSEIHASQSGVQDFSPPLDGLDLEPPPPAFFEPHVTDHVLPPPEAEPEPTPSREQDPSGVDPVSFFQNGGFGVVPPFASTGYTIGTANQREPDFEITDDKTVYQASEYQSESAEMTVESLVETLQRIMDALLYLKSQTDEINDILERSFG